MAEPGALAVESQSTRPARPPGLTWDWSPAALGALCALPAAALILSDRSQGLALAVGVLPAALMGVAPRRRARIAVVVLGALVGLSMFVGGVLASVPVLAVVAIALLGVGSAWLAARARIGRLAMTLALPLVGVGLSYSDTGTAAGAAGLMVAGSLIACAVSMLWPEHPAAPRGPLPAPPTLAYGIRLGARFGERLAETVLGVGLAYVFGLALPALRRRHAT